MPPRDFRPPQAVLDGLSDAGPPPGEPIDGQEVTLEGVVDQIFFTNEENGWTAAKVELPAERRRVRVVGSMPGVAQGDPVQLTGRWVNDPKWGPQLRVSRFTARVPTNVEGIRRYLGSGLVEGIGEGLAHRLVDAFGKDTLEVIEHDPDRLQEVEGIGKKRAAAIREALGKQRAVKQVMVFLQGHGLSASKAVAVYRQYGSEAVTTLRQNPYRLADDVFGIGFTTADRIAGSLGIGPDAPFRIQAGLVYVLGQAADDGHLYLPEPELVQHASGLLDVEEALVAQELPLLERSGEVIAEEVDGPAGEPLRACYRPRLYHAERELAARLRALLAATGRPVRARWEAVRGRVEQSLGVALASAQADAVATALRDKVVVITGGPGTGKTTILRGLLEVLETEGFAVELAAPTGRAAKRMHEATGRSARTLHRLLEFVPRAGGFQRNPERPLEADVVVVDEVSMLDVPLARALARALPAAVRLVLVGDADQLPSVGPGAVLAQIIRSGVLPVVRLTEVFRQAARSQIVVGAHQVNQGQPLRPPPTQGPPGTAPGELFVVETEDAGHAARIIERTVCERIPERYGLDPVDDVQVLSPTKRGHTGTLRLNELLQSRLNPGGEQISRGGHALRAGAKVMQLRKNYDKDVFNGARGGVLVRQQAAPAAAGGPAAAGAGAAGSTSRAVGQLQLIVRFDDRLVRYRREELEQLTLSYACTVHKSQGSEFPAVVMPLLGEHYMLLQRNLLYTALTRAQQLFVLVGSSRAIRRAIRNDQVRQRYTALAQRLRG